jgi:hypothetical protein
MQDDLTHMTYPVVAVTDLDEDEGPPNPHERQRRGRDHASHGNLRGQIARDYILMLLHKKALWSRRPTPGHLDPHLSWNDLHKMIPHFPKADSIRLTPAEREMWVDLSPYMRMSPYVIFEHAPLSRAYKLVRCDNMLM